MEGIKKVWPLMLLRGLISILFGALIIIYPVLTLSLLMIFFAAYVLVWGIFTLFYALKHRAKPGWGVALTEGLIGAVVGLTILCVPKISALMLLYIVSVWAILTGIMQLWIAIRYREQVNNDFWIGLSGIVSILFGTLILVYPHDGILAIAWLLGVYAIIIGIILSALAFKLKSVK